MTKSKMGLLRSTLVMITATWLSTWPSMALAENATIAVEVPLKSSSALIGGKTVQTLSPGTAIKILETKSTMSRVELTDDPSVQGWVLTASITRNQNVTSAIATSKSAKASATNTKTAIASAMGGVGKGFSDESAKATSTAKSLSGSVGAVAKGKIQAATDELEGEAEDIEAAAGAVVAGFKGKSAATLEKIESTKVSETDIASFMKEGGLRSRLIR